MPRRGGRDRWSAKECRRAKKDMPVPAQRPSFVKAPDSPGSVTLEAPPDWMVVGAKVHYCSIIGQDPTKLDCVITQPPFRVPGRYLQWVTFIDKVRGYVAIEALVRAA